MRKHKGLPWCLCTAVSLLPAVFAANAGATDCTQTTYPYASPSYTNYDCPTGDDYLVFGKVWVEGVPGSGIYGLAGIGICQFESSGSWDKGDYVTYVVASADVTDYRVRADSASGSTGGEDVVRMADISGEQCRASGGYGSGVKGVRIVGDLDSGDTFLFWGDKGDDHLRLCDNTSGPSWDCSDNEGRADGREGADTIYGTYLSEDLWGGSGTYIDDIYGNDGSDHIYAGPGDDNIWAGAGNDWVYGEDGADHIYGSSGTDYLFGGAGGDHLIGGTERDELSGGDGDDTLEGGDGDDTLVGGDGADTLIGDDGADTLWGYAVWAGDDGDYDYCYCGDNVWPYFGDWDYCGSSECSLNYCDHTCSYEEDGLGFDAPRDEQEAVSQDEADAGEDGPDAH